MKKGFVKYVLTIVILFLLAVCLGAVNEFIRQGAYLKEDLISYIYDGLQPRSEYEEQSREEHEVVIG